jgi:hypothetical protein
MSLFKELEVLEVGQVYDTMPEIPKQVGSIRVGAFTYGNKLGRKFKVHKYYDEQRQLHVKVTRVS